MADNLEKAIEEASQEIGGGNGTSKSGGTNQDPNLFQIQQLAQSDPTFANSDEYKSMVASLSQRSVNTDEDDVDFEEEEDEDDVDLDDTFGVTKNQKSEKKVKIDFDAPKEMKDFLERTYGIKDAETFFNSANTWRQQAQEGSELKKNHEAILDDLSSMPPELKRAVSAWANGGDFREELMNDTRLDWSSDYYNQDKEGLVQHYLLDDYNELVDKLNADAIDSDEFDKQITILAKATRSRFNGDKKALDDDRANYSTKIAEDQRKFRGSALSSVDNLNKAFPSFKKSELGKIRSTLVEGKLDEFFYNPDGTYKENAAELIAFAMYGKQMTDTLMKRGERKGESRANLEMVDKSPKRMRQSKDSNDKRASSNEMQAVQHLSSMIKPKSIFD